MIALKENRPYDPAWENNGTDVDNDVEIEMNEGDDDYENEDE